MPATHRQLELLYRCRDMALEIVKPCDHSASRMDAWIGWLSRYTNGTRNEISALLTFDKDKRYPCGEVVDVISKAIEENEQHQTD